MSDHLIRGLKSYIGAERPEEWLFNGQPQENRKGGDFDSRYSQKGVQWAVKQAAKKTFATSNLRIEDVPMFNTTLTAPPLGLRREVNRLLEEAMTRSAMAPWAPPADISETNGELAITMEIPGVRPEDVEVTSENGLLTIRGSRETSHESSSDRLFHVIERNLGSFSRSFRLPNGLDDSKVTASFDNGLLSIHVPKTALPQPRRIAVKTGSESADGRTLQSGSAREPDQLVH